MALAEGIDKISLLTKRDSERKQDIQKRKDDRTEHYADNEKLAVFEQSFTLKRNSIEELIKKSRELSKIALPDHFNVISKEILVLQKYAAASNFFLRTYDIKKCQEAIQDLTLAAKELEDQMLPKKKFGFKNRPKAAPPTPKIDQVDASEKIPVVYRQDCGFVNKTGETLAISREEMARNDVTAENLDNCVVKLLGSPSTLHLNHLRNCTVLTGPVSTSIFAEDCVDCTLVIACQQLRLHSSKGVRIYLHVTSRAIMEDCRDILVAPYNLKYAELEQDFRDAVLDNATIQWRKIDDFNWLSVEKPSPNWAELPEDARTASWDALLLN